MKNKSIFIIILFAVMSIGMASCEKSTPYEPSPRENFEALWRIMDQNYCFFDYKDVDWNEVYERYSAQITDTMDQFALFDLLGDMLAEVKDGHTNLYSSFDVARYWGWYEDYPPNFYEDVQKQYLGTDYKIAGGMKYKKLADDKVGYVYYGSFSSGVGDNNLDYMLYYFKDCKGLIFDIRDNGGGMLSYAEKIASRFIEEKILAGYIQYKNGNGHNDFTEPKAVYVEPSDRIRWFRPVVLLTNRHTYSAANDFTSIMRTIPHVTTLGDKTGGGCGMPFSSELPIGWSVRFSACPMLDADMQLTEFGIEPDIKCLMTTEEAIQGKDACIDSAIELILKADENEE